MRFVYTWNLCLGGNDWASCTKRGGMSTKGRSRNPRPSLAGCTEVRKSGLGLDVLRLGEGTHKHGPNRDIPTLRYGYRKSWKES